MSSSYVIPTGPGYQGRYTLANYSLRISIGANQCVSWQSDDSVFVGLEAEDTLALVEDPSALQNSIGKATVRREGVGTVVQVQARAVRAISVDASDDVRVYARDPDGLLVVPADDDPVLDGERQNVCP